MDYKQLYSKDKKQIVLILLASFIIKLILSFTLTADIRSDSLDYHLLAKSIAFEGEYSLNGKPTATSTIGYPLFVSFFYALFGADQIPLRIGQSLLEIITGLLFFYFCLNFLDKKRSIISLAIFSFFPSNILYSQTILTESLFGLLNLIILIYFLREKIDWKILLIGMIAGYAVLVRSSFAPCLLLVPIFLFVYNRKLFDGYKQNRLKKAVQYSLLFFAGSVLIITPWIIRNKIVLNTFAIGTHGGSTFWSGSNPDATGTWYHRIEDTNPIFQIQDEAEKDRAFYKAGIEYALKNPHRFIITGFKKIGYLFSSERMILLYFTKDEARARTSSEVYKNINPLISALVNIPYFIIMLIGTWGLLIKSKKMFFIYGQILFWLFTFFIFVALSRYHYVLIPFFILGTVKFSYGWRRNIRLLTIPSIITAIIFNLFLIAVWTIEFYLLYK